MHLLILLSRFSTFTGILAYQGSILSNQNLLSDHGLIDGDTVQLNRAPTLSAKSRLNRLHRRNGEPTTLEDDRLTLLNHRVLFRRGTKGKGKQSGSKGGASASGASNSVALNKPQRIQQLNTQIGSQPRRGQSSEKLSALGPQWSSPAGSRDSSPARSIKGILDTPGQMSRQNTLNTGSSLLRTSSSQDLLSSKFFPPQGPPSHETQSKDAKRAPLATQYSPMKPKDPRGPSGGPLRTDQASPQSLESKRSPPRRSPSNRGPLGAPGNNPQSPGSSRPQSPVPDIDSVVSTMSRARLSSEHGTFPPSSYQTPQRQGKSQGNIPPAPVAPGPRPGGQVILGQGLGGSGPSGQGASDPTYSPVSLGWSSPKSTFSTPAKQVQPHKLDFGSGGEQSNLSPVSIGYKTPSPPPKGQRRPESPQK